MIVDNEKILSALMTEYAQYDSVVIPIYSDMSKHRVHNRLSLLYICIIDINKTYTLLVNHSDKLFDIDNLKFIIE